MTITMACGGSSTVMRGAQADHSPAFRQLVHLGHHRTMGTVRRFISCREDGDDVAGDVCVCPHISIGQLRKLRRRVVPMAEMEKPSVNGRSHLADGLLAHSSPTDRVPIVKSEVEASNKRELGALLGVRIGAVRGRLFRARNRPPQVLNPRARKTARAMAGSGTVTAQNT